ncbi:TPA: signal peptidase I [Patescibacteria group bacterium]|nr:signal peptidase I [Candidatus Gracilibacteria bacterium]
MVLFVRFFIANPYTVVGASMAPTFQENDFIIVDKITPRFGELARGDIIVFVPPGKTVPYIKRVV